MKQHILVVEDNLANRELLCDWLEAEGFEVLVAENLEQGFAAFNIQPPQAVLLDVQLGPEDGLSLAKWIRREPKLRYILVIAVTAQSGPNFGRPTTTSTGNAPTSPFINGRLINFGFGWKF